MIGPKELYNMGMHETLVESKGLNVLTISRVPGGWVYGTDNRPSVFVPLNDEFLAAENTKNHKPKQKTKMTKGEGKMGHKAKVILIVVLVLAIVQILLLTKCEAFETEITIQKDIYANESLDGGQTLMGRIYFDLDEISPFVYGSWGETTYRGTKGMQPLTEIDIYSAGLGVKKSLFKNLSIYGQIGWFEPVLSNSGLDKTEQTHEAISYLLHDQLVGWDSEFIDLFPHRSIDIDGNIGGQVGANFEYAFTDTFKLSLTGSYRILDLYHRISAKYYEDTGDVLRLNGSQDYSGPSIGFSLEFDF